MTWREQALCAQVDPALFDPDLGKKTRTVAVGVCRACPVTQACLDDALAVETPSTCHGVRGGLSARARARLLPRGVRVLAPHGTPAAEKRHWRAGEPPCATCLDGRERRRLNPRREAS